LTENLFNDIASSAMFQLLRLYEYFTAPGSHLQISQHQANVKHETFTVSYHSYTTFLPQNNWRLYID